MHCEFHVHSALWLQPWWEWQREGSHTLVWDCREDKYVKVSAPLPFPRTFEAFESLTIPVTTVRTLQQRDREADPRVRASTREYGDARAGDEARDPQ